MPQDVRLVAVKPNDATKPAFSVAANGFFDLLDDSTTAVTFAINLTALTGGTTPSVTFSIVGVDEFNVEYVLQTGTALTAAGTQVLSQGPGTGGNAAASAIFIKYRLKWTVTGGPATATATVSAYGIANV